MNATRPFLACMLMLTLHALLVAPRLGMAAPSSPQVETLTAKVDQRVELMSVVARLAGYDEYVQNAFKLYADAVDTHFSRYRDHPAVQLARKVRTQDVGYDAVMAMAVYLKPPPLLTPGEPFSDRIPDRRWGKTAADEFARLLQQFYRDTDAAAFFQSQNSVYRTAEERFQEVLRDVDLGWYKRFYGEAPRGSFNLILGLLNGGQAYGPKVIRPNGDEDIYAILGAWQTDADGLPKYDRSVVPTIVHEYNHSYINHLVEEYADRLESAGPRIYQPVAESMRRLAYGTWNTMIVESLVRAATLRYRFEHELASEAVVYGVQSEQNRGFVWMDDLFALLGAYEGSRSSFPTFRSFMIPIVGYFNDLSKRIDFKMAAFDLRRPQVAALQPFLNGASDVNPSITQVTIDFDSPLGKTGYTFNVGPSGKEHFPLDKVVGFNDAGTAITIQVKLRPGWDYEFIVGPGAFRTKDGIQLKPYLVHFRTRQDEVR